MGIEDDKPEKGVLSFNDNGKILSLESLESEFEEMKAELGDKQDLVKKFRDIGKESGNFVPKLNISRASSAFKMNNLENPENRKWYFSGNSANSAYAKVAHRPLNILGISGSRSLIEHLAHKTNVSARVAEAFANVFGHDVLTAIEEGLAISDNKDDIYTENFPVVFAPSANGDIQITPIIGYEPYKHIRKVKAEFRDTEKFLPTSARFIAVQAQNIAGGASSTVLMLKASYPKIKKDSKDIQDYYLEWESRIGQFFSPDLDEKVHRFIDRIRTQQTEDAYVNRDILAGNVSYFKSILNTVNDWLGEQEDTVKQRTMNLTEELKLVRKNLKTLIDDERNEEQVVMLKAQENALLEQIERLDSVEIPSLLDAVNQYFDRISDGEDLLILKNELSKKEIVNYIKRFK